MKILGIHDGHNGAAALFENGRIVAAIQEERLRYEKNWTGYPEKAVEWVLSYSGVSADQIDVVVFNGNHMPADLNKNALIAAHKRTWGMTDRFKSVLKKSFVGTAYTNKLKEQRINRALKSGFTRDVVRFVDHHQCHASAAYYGWGQYQEPVLVLTCDGAGDRICASVNIGEKGELRRIASVKETESIGSLYACITTVMGFVPLEHEYKLMGMAPYAESKYAEEVAEIFRKHFAFDSVDGLTWGRAVNCPPPYFSYWYWRDQLEGKRFDAIMGGLQIFAEEFIAAWVKNCIRKTGIRKVALGGGFFMNVKANKVIMELPEVDDLFVFPSCGDEMNAIGACFAIAAEHSAEHSIPALSDIYWGPEYSEEEIQKSLDEYSRKSELVVENCDKSIHARVARLLADGAVVARFAGREEMGARSLGNRAILANPQNPNVIVLINNMIKKRDFWMPFASSMKKEWSDRYLVNPKGISAPYMILTFDTTEDGRRDLYAGTHPQDKTVRPQEVTRESNPQYWELLDEYEKLTGSGGFLNTSFNLHGFPVVHTPEQALDVLLASGLPYLQLGGFLIGKKR